MMVKASAGIPITTTKKKKPSPPPSCNYPILKMCVGVGERGDLPL